MIVVCTILEEVWKSFIPLFSTIQRERRGREREKREGEKEREF